MVSWGVILSIKKLAYVISKCGNSWLIPWHVTSHKISPPLLPFTTCGLENMCYRMRSLIGNCALSIGVRDGTHNSPDKSWINKEETQFFGIFRILWCEKDVQKDPGCFYTLSHPFIRFRRLYMLSYAFIRFNILSNNVIYTFLHFSMLL